MYVLQELMDDFSAELASAYNTRKAVEVNGLPPRPYDIVILENTLTEIADKVAFMGYDELNTQMLVVVDGVKLDLRAANQRGAVLKTTYEQYTGGVK